MQNIFDDKIHKEAFQHLLDNYRLETANAFQAAQIMSTGLTEKDELTLLLDRVTDYCIIELDGAKHRSVLWELAVMYFWESAEETENAVESLEEYCKLNVDGWDWIRPEFDIGLHRPEDLIGSAFKTLEANWNRPQLAVIISKCIHKYIQVLLEHDYKFNYSLLKHTIEVKPTINRKK